MERTRRDKYVESFSFGCYAVLTYDERNGGGQDGGPPANALDERTADDASGQRPQGHETADPRLLRHGKSSSTESIS